MDCVDLKSIIESLRAVVNYLPQKVDKISPLSAALLIKIYESNSFGSPEWYATIKYVGEGALKLKNVL